MRYIIAALSLSILFLGCKESEEAINTTDAYQRLNDLVVDGSITGKQVQFTVYLPPAYFTNSQRRFPVVYHLHGLNDQHNASQINTLPDFMEQVWANGIWEEAIIVFPDGETNSMWSDAVNQSKLVETHIIQEIIPYVDATFRTKATGEHRFIQGFSMGGFGALKLIGRYPELFAKAISFDGALHNWTTFSFLRADIAAEMFNSDQTQFEATADPILQVLSNQSLFQNKKRIHLNYGTLGIVQQLNTTAHQALNQHGILHDYEYSNCGHDLSCILTNLGDRLFEFYEY